MVMVSFKDYDVCNLGHKRIGGGMILYVNTGACVLYRMLTSRRKGKVPRLAIVGTIVDTILYE